VANIAKLPELLRRDCCLLSRSHGAVVRKGLAVDFWSDGTILPIDLVGLDHSAFSACIMHTAQSRSVEEFLAQ
jgi:hypothetical protein